MRIKHLVILVALMLALVWPASPTSAGGVVTICDEAHLLAALAGGGTVTFTCSGTITQSAEITVAADTTIDGSGQTVTLSGNNAVRVFVVNPGIALNLNSLTIADGLVSGASGEGGGINNYGILNVSNSTLSANNAAYGGGIYNNGTLTVSNGNFAGNNAGYGGGINNHGTLTVNNSSFSSNGASSGGGGIHNYSGTLTVSNSALTANSAGKGGGIHSFAPISVSNSRFSANTAAGDGGAIALEGADVVVSLSTFSSNSAAFGGGIYIYGSTLEIGKSTFSANTASYFGGGIYSDSYATVTVSNSTFSTNSAVHEGGGIRSQGTVTIINSTLSGNSAGTGGGIMSTSGVPWLPVTLKNTIVANSLAGGNCAGTLLDGSGNLSYPDTTCPGINADPVLGPLQNNGGPTETMALLPGSAALDAANDAICAAPPVNNLDQRGVLRPQGLHCDIGAVEKVPGPTAVRLLAPRAQSSPGPVMPAIMVGLLAAVWALSKIRRYRVT